jgi:DNA polymerase-3 subunit alpha
VAASLDSALEGGASAQRDREIGQENLFGSSLETSVGISDLPDVPSWSESERLSGEKEVLGFYVSGHPLEGVVDKLAKVTNVRSGTSGERIGRDARAGGLLTSLRETRTRRGATMAFGTLEDLDGLFELVIFAEPYKHLRPLLKSAAELSNGRVIPLVLEGTLEAGDPPKLLVREGWELDKAEEFLAKALKIRLPVADITQDRLLALRAVFEQYRGDCSVLVHVVIPGESETVLALPDVSGVNASIELCRAVDGLFGRPVAELTR